MYLIDGTYFIRENSVPNLQELNGNESELIQFIDEKVPSLLQMILGYVNFKDLDSQIIDGVLDSGADQKWKDLVEGKEYVREGKTVKWSGLIYELGTFKSSLLADYVYYEWLRYNVSQITGIGEAINTAKNGINVNSNQRLVDAWNRFYTKSVGYCYNTPHVYYHNGVKVIDWFGKNNIETISLFTFLKDNETDYPDCAFILPENGYKNQLGL